MEEGGEEGRGGGERRGGGGGGVRRLKTFNMREKKKITLTGVAQVCLDRSGHL